MSKQPTLQAITGPSARGHGRLCSLWIDLVRMPTLGAGLGEKIMISRKCWPRIQRGLFATVFLCLTLAFGANSQVKTETSVEEGLPSQTIKIETGEVVYVSGRDLVVKTEDGELRHFPNVSDDKTVNVAGKQLTIHDLKPGMKLQRTTITSTTPRMITTVRTVTGKVWRVSPPNSVILRLEDGTNQSFNIPKGQKFNVDGQEIDAWGLKDGMNISATAVTETPETVVSQEVIRTGTPPLPKPEPPKQGRALLVVIVPAK
jgi:ribosomal protein L21E